MRPAIRNIPDVPLKEATAKKTGSGESLPREGLAGAGTPEIIARQCTDCKLCRKECQFLRNYGGPKSIAAAYDPSDRVRQGIAFECSLCGLCTAVCPVGLDPAGMFLEMRREAVRRAGGDYPEHGGILAYERRGTSPRYTWYAFPRDCDTVFFPGCTLPGTRPEKVKLLFERLQETVPNLGMVLDCCMKPSHDLGREHHFHAMFDEMKAYLLDHGIRNILVACPNCHKVFRTHGTEFDIKTVYELLAGEGTVRGKDLPVAVTIHDPCAVRFEGPIHEAVRDLVVRSGVGVEEMAHHGNTALCCGEGGSAGFLSPELASKWLSIRKEEAHGRRIITYCAGCTNHLGKATPTDHVLDLFFDPEPTLAGKAKVSGAPVTYWNRIRLKAWFKKNLPSPVTRERTFQIEKPAGKRTLFVRLMVLALIAGAVLAFRMTGAMELLEPEALRNSIQGCGIWAPLLYMLLYAVAPVLFLPGLPITIVGGMLFGPIWGVVYTITGSTLGACLAFLVSRHLARDWVEGKLKSPRWRKLDDEVERHGWKVVALTRLIPLFPFNLLNYAFGLTKVKFLHYAAATFLFMLPACIAFIVFSSSLPDVIRGNFSPEFAVGLGLVILISLIPVIYRKRRS